MANYFKRLPNINYQNLEELGFPGRTLQNKNLFRRAKLREDIASNTTFFEDYFIKSDERPDNVAFKVYGEEDLDWVVLITNNILNIQEEWPLPTNLYNEYLLEKYGSYEAIYEVHHYESKVITSVDGVTVLPGGLLVDQNFRFEYYEETLDSHVSIEDCSVAVTNYIYEERIQEKKRAIKILKPKYLNLVFEDIAEVMSYRKGSTGFISRTLKDTESI
jgi:hypothetical protein